jgi:heme A synthase
MASNQTQRVLAAIVGLILISLGMESCSNSSELVPTNGCFLLIAGLIIFSGILGGFGNPQDSNPTQEEE